MGIKEDIKRSCDKGNNSLLKELNKLHERNALLPKRKENMSYKERNEPLDT